MSTDQGRSNVVAFRTRQSDNSTTTLTGCPQDMKNWPVAIRGSVTFGRLMAGLATVGLAVRIDPASGHVVIVDDPCAD
jgi:hypothetical protein